MFEDTRRIARKPSTRQLAAIDRQIEQVYYRVGAGVAIDVMDIGKVFTAGREAVASGADLDAAITAAVKLYAQPIGGRR